MEKDIRRDRERRTQEYESRQFRRGRSNVLYADQNTRSREHNRILSVIQNDLRNNSRIYYGYP